MRNCNPVSEARQGRSNRKGSDKPGHVQANMGMLLEALWDPTLPGCEGSLSPGLSQWKQERKTPLESEGHWKKTWGSVFCHQNCEDGHRNVRSSREVNHFQVLKVPETRRGRSGKEPRAQEGSATTTLARESNRPCSQLSKSRRDIIQS